MRLDRLNDMCLPFLEDWQVLRVARATRSCDPARARFYFHPNGRGRPRYHELHDRQIVISRKAASGFSGRYPLPPDGELRSRIERTVMGHRGTDAPSASKVGAWGKRTKERYAVSHDLCATDSPSSSHNLKALRNVLIINENGVLQGLVFVVRTALELVRDVVIRENDVLKVNV